ncbi:MAG: hypothetical protein COV45_05165 [Deltaproteobacteria bacterium CG11_big_fil_rev_8_21_14_0_20_47_16]|nr:MAG: hypothetical protein COV45_05165 [Deltaproteobacteria bacterium CG11_big_fil_rev_8_21_14_0_20_47_16]
MRLFLILLVAGIFSVSVVEACTVTTPQDILTCALEKHPDVINAESEKLRDDHLVDIAKQRPNPVLQSLFLSGKNFNDSNLTENSLLLTFELGGKRKSRINQASVLAEKSGLEVRRNREEIALRTVLTLYRLRQIRSELSRIEETISTFSKIITALKSRPKLTPEQEVSQSSFSLVREDYKLKKITLIQEQAGLVAWLEVATGVPEQIILRHLPLPKANWPEFPVSMETESLSNATVALARSEKTLAERNSAIAKSKAWPDLQIGPSFATEDLMGNGSSTGFLGGFSLSVPIPVLNLNRGGKAFAQADQSRAETNLDLTIQKTSAEKILQFKRYQAAIKALRSTRQINGMATDHEKIEEFFEKGLVTSVLVIETHRQLYDITRTRNEQELTGIDALWKLYILEGTALDAKI